MEDPNIQYSKLESDRFGIRIFRGKINQFETSTIRELILENKVDTLILRLPTNTIATHAKLLDLGFPVIHADSLVYYACPLQETNIEDLKNQLIFEPIDKKNVEILKEMIPVIFKDYQNHYYSNPLLDKSKINEGYIEWASSCIHQDNIKGWIVKDKTKNINIGFFTTSYNKDNMTSEGVLYGVLPEYSGQGFYSDIIKFTLKYYKDLKYEKTFMPTQLQNYRVQNVLSKSGYFLSHSFETYHINSILSKK